RAGPESGRRRDRERIAKMPRCCCRLRRLPPPTGGGPTICLRAANADRQAYPRTDDGCGAWLPTKSDRLAAPGFRRTPDNTRSISAAERNDASVGGGI